MKKFLIIGIGVFFIALTSCTSTAPEVNPEVATEDPVVVINPDSAPTTSQSYTVDPNLARVDIYRLDGATVHRFVSIINSKDDVSSYVIETQNNLVIIDVQEKQSRAKELRKYVDSLGKEVERVIISHSHSPHYFGLNNFDNFPIYALPEVSRNIAKRNAGILANDYKNLKAKGEYPSRVIIPNRDLPTKFSVDGLEYNVLNFQNTENADETIILLPSLKAAITADFLEKNAHLIVIDTKAYLRGLDIISGLENEGYQYLFPMYGEICKFSDIPAIRAYIKSVENILAEKPDFTEYKSAIESKYPSYGSADFVARLMRQYSVFVNNR